jgi:type I restriction enzyme R subunit
VVKVSDVLTLTGASMLLMDYYRTTLLAEETDPNKLHDLKAALDAAPSVFA